jgi:hypothetical protein
LNRSKRFERLERLKRPRYRFSAIKEFYFRLTYLGKVQAINKVGGLVERRLNDLTAATHDAKAQDRALPEVLIAALRDGNIELV